MSDVAMAISTDADTDADVACLSHHSPSKEPVDRDVITADRDISDCNQLL